MHTRRHEVGVTIRSNTVSISDEIMAASITLNTGASIPAFGLG